ncbi:uncharacterized protein PHALS_04616 [Plasmopara halstedii]|uniref:Uncharacterized protein n=1 Tax=Plasmopara halstedii TaxID=4781 RepID=A0A0P1A993_PLAHL|nr:uncharacterized protein PHALS_04616 [Plasmopara halstedii]CEG37168.1 hypothetical protein PHALS_04616 [Plasmopara halstedii]|eukprot:XP_024573537.1 hypothetical protein PHALS_04616 [Plasmopara halstedii]
MTGRTGMREAEEVLPLLALETGSSVVCASSYDHSKLLNNDQLSKAPYQCAGYVSYVLKKDSSGSRRQLTAVYGSIPSVTTRKGGSLPIITQPAVTDSLLGGSDQQSNQSETESDSDGSCTTSSTNGSLQSILRMPSTDFSCRSLKKRASVDFALDIDSGEDDDTKEGLKGSCAARCLPRRLTIEEKTALYRVRPDLELVPTVLLLSELEELRRRRQRNLMFSSLGASLILLMVIVFYYLVSQM